jgi:hypothetical protein
MRRDYYNLLSAPECRALYQRLEAQNRAALYRLGRMSNDGLRQIVIKPLRLAGVGLNECRELAASVLQDVGERPGDLALVQFALTRAWERRHEFDGSLVRAYAGVGRVDGALAEEAERVFKDVLGGEANEAEVAATLIRLARLEGTAGPTRRVARRREFTDSRWTLLQTLADVKGNRLVLTQNLGGSDTPNPEGTEETAEIAHEALLTRWPQLHAWLSEAPEDKRTLDRLADRAAEWADAATPKARDRLLARTDAEREAFDALAHARPFWLSAGERAFIASSVADQENRTRRARWLRNAALAAAAIFLVASGLATFFWSNATQQAERARTAEREAVLERDKARAQLLAIQARRVNAEADAPDEIERAGALALESIQITREGNRPAEADAVETIRSALIRLPLLVLQHGRGVSSLAAGVTSLAVLGDGRLASGDDDGQIKLWPKDGTGEPVVLRHSSGVLSLAVLTDGRLASSGGLDGQIRLWPNDGTGEPVVLRHGGSVDALAALPNGRLASGGDDGRIKLWPNDGTGEPVTLDHDSWVRSLAVLTDRRLASGGGDGQIKLWPKDGTGEPTVLTHGSDVQSLAALADGRLASGSLDGQIKLWLVEEEKLIAALCLRAGRNLSKGEWARYIGFDTPWQSSCRGRPSNWRTPDL